MTNFEKNIFQQSCRMARKQIEEKLSSFSGEQPTTRFLAETLALLSDVEKRFVIVFGNNPQNFD